VWSLTVFTVRTSEEIGKAKQARLDFTASRAGARCKLWVAHSRLVWVLLTEIRRINYGYLLQANCIWITNPFSFTDQLQSVVKLADGSLYFRGWRVRLTDRKDYVEEDSETRFLHSSYPALSMQVRLGCFHALVSPKRRIIVSTDGESTPRWLVYRYNE
jgi:hypothetical protein